MINKLGKKNTQWEGCAFVTEIHNKGGTAYPQAYWIMCDYDDPSTKGDNPTQAKEVVLFILPKL